VSSLAQLEERIKALEEDSHAPVGWQRKIDDLENQIDRLVEQLEKYGI
tara:strand:+ start:444 stop:587 length:144 start_codon:yes stop_codon:yes gene_type:complete